MPSKAEDHDNIIKILQVCNRDIPPYDWKVVKTEGADNARMRVVLLLNEDCIGPLDRVMKYAFGKTRLPRRCSVRQQRWAKQGYRSGE